MVCFPAGGRLFGHRADPQSARGSLLAGDDLRKALEDIPGRVVTVKHGFFTLALVEGLSVERKKVARSLLSPGGFRG